MVAILLHPVCNGLNRYVNFLHSLVYNDKIVVQCMDGLDCNNVKVVFENELAINERRGSYVLISKYQKVIRVVVLEKGRQVAPVPYDYGKQDLAVFYDDVRIGALGYWKTMPYHVHDYMLILKKENGRIYMEGEIKGPDQTISGVTNERKN